MNQSQKEKKKKKINFITRQSLVMIESRNQREVNMYLNKCSIRGMYWKMNTVCLYNMIHTYRYVYELN